eukprot:TRINITY_DN21849_c0_g1_i1.p1 TRINITY_DN21849_c0_g1~~TRINITY_DN21849_c0_g1_i1.p1  ORF type:complete len:735 (-),score=149.85 TRINITY_DN21849_c0_g1_i1:102-2306(-)
MVHGSVVSKVPQLLVNATGVKLATDGGDSVVLRSPQEEACSPVPWHFVDLAVKSEFPLCYVMSKDGYALSVMEKAGTDAPVTVVKHPKLLHATSSKRAHWHVVPLGENKFNLKSEASGFFLAASDDGRRVVLSRNPAAPQSQWHVMPMKKNASVADRLISSSHSSSSTSYHHGILDKAREFVKDGWISKKEAIELWSLAVGEDEDKLTDFKQRTIELTLKLFRYTHAARAELEQKLREAQQWQNTAEEYEKYKRVLFFGMPRGSASTWEHLMKTFLQEHFPRCRVKTLQTRDSSGQHLKTPYVDFSSAKTCNAVLRKMETITEEAIRAHFSGANVKIKGAKPWFSFWWRRIKPSSSFPGYPSFPIIMPKKEHRFSLVLLHPLGNVSTFFFDQGGGLVRHLSLGSHTVRNYCKILCPSAKLRCGQGWQWFQYLGDEKQRRCDDESIDEGDLLESREFITSVLENEAKLLGTAQRVILDGYSQGGSLSLDVGLRFPRPLGLVISQRGMLMKVTLEAHKKMLRDNTACKQNLLMTAGGLDDVYPAKVQAHCRDRLKALYEEAYEADGHISYQCVEHLDHCGYDDEEHEAILKHCIKVFRTMPGRVRQVAESSSKAGLKRSGSFLERCSTAKKARRLSIQHSGHTHKEAEPLQREASPPEPAQLPPQQLSPQQILAVQTDSGGMAAKKQHLSSKSIQPGSRAGWFLARASGRNAAQKAGRASGKRSVTATAVAAKGGS